MLDVKELNNPEYMAEKIGVMPIVAIDPKTGTPTPTVVLYLRKPDNILLTCQDSKGVEHLINQLRKNIIQAKKDLKEAENER